MKNKKGFTLVELLAVMVILIIIIIIAYAVIKRNVDETLDNTIKANAGIYIKAANGLISEKSITDASYDSGFLSVSQLNSEGLKISGTKPDSGYVIIANSEVTTSCLNYEDYYIEYTNGDLGNPTKGKCAFAKFEYVFEYTGDSQTFKIPYNGTYTFEVWGAQGGGKQVTNISELGVGGKGGYSIGSVYLTSNDVIFINVGGEGVASTSGIAKGGFNGGGDAWASSSDDPAAGGGGATDIRIGTNDLYHRLIVAGGGGGGGEDNETGGYAGGTAGAGSYGGTQNSSSSGAVFGLGANTSYDGGGGGGGWYGGGTPGGTQDIVTSNSTSDTGGGSGGSGYVFTSSSELVQDYGLTSQYYLSDANIIAGNNTMPSHDGTETMTGNSGNGYAKITVEIGE